jgi:hypothetical protein
LIDKADASLAAENRFGIGFYRSEKDFVEIRPAGKSEYMLWSDIITKSERSGILGFFSKRKNHIDRIIMGRLAAAEAVYYYIDHSREEFERRYS